MSYPRRQEFRRPSRAGTAMVGSAITGLLALDVASMGVLSLAGLLLLAAVALGFSARRSLVLAKRSRVGARSEDEVRKVLAPLRGEGWRVHHSLPWRGRGDIDSVAIAPGGVEFVIEVKTSRYDHRHLALVREQATWLSRFRRRWCRQGAVPVLCVARARGLNRWEDGVLVVSIDRLIPALQSTRYGVESAALPF